MPGFMAENPDGENERTTGVLVIFLWRKRRCINYQNINMEKHWSIDWGMQCYLVGKKTLINDFVRQQAIADD